MTREGAHRAATKPPDGCLWVECHCTADVVAVPVELIGRETGACRRCGVDERAAA